MRTLTAIEAAELMDDETLATVNRWLARGDGVAVYRDEDFSTPEHYKFASFGSPDSMFEGEPEQQLPDTTQQINWRYQLYGVYRGKQLEPAATHDFATPESVLRLVIDSFENRDLYDVPNRLIAYTLSVGHEPSGAANCLIELEVRHAPAIEDEWVRISLSAPTHEGWKVTHAGAMVDRLGPWSWLIEHSTGENLSGGEPNLGGAKVSIYNLSAKKPGEGT